MTRNPISKESPVTLVGHPFATVGMGEQFRSHISACRSVEMDFKVVDIFRYAERSDPSHYAVIGSHEIDVPVGGIRIFHVNADEIDAVLQAFEARGGGFSEGYNIVVPAWELPTYPREWVGHLKQFDEVWALSRFIETSLAAAGISSRYVGQPVELPRDYFLPRKYFGIRESAFVFLHFFDLSSFATRKNPESVLKMFESLRQQRPFADIQLVLKVKNADKGAEDWLAPILKRLPEALCLGRKMNSLETRSLINCCDCFVSLHRAEGFGRGTGEAMFLGRLALATAWSGNLDYMSGNNSILVDYKLVPVVGGEYPFGEGQKWADPDVDNAVQRLEELLENAKLVRAIAERGRREVRLAFSFRAVGLRILDRVTEIATALARDHRPSGKLGVSHSTDHSGMDSEARAQRKAVRDSLPVALAKTISRLPTKNGK